MNYYEHHLGDYVRDTAHLSMLEDGAYRRLIDACYIRERPLPLDSKECCKLARATSKPERDAVAYVLKEFFEERSDGYHQRRVDAEIERFQSKSRKAKASAEARWQACERNANASETHMPTQCEGNALQSPVSNPQSPDKNSPPTRASEAEISESMRSIRAEYPPIAGRVDWITAEKGARTLALNGDATWLQLIGGVGRYRKHVEATGSYAMNPSKFFTALDRPWSQEWVVLDEKPNGKARKNKFAQAMEALDRA